MKDTICPICGEPNNCAIANGLNPEECWCMKVNFPKEIFDKIPKDKKNKACVCKKCLEKIKENL